MAKLIAFADAFNPEQMIWIHPDAVEKVMGQPNDNAVVFFRSGASPLTVGGAPDLVVSKLNAASE